MCVLSPLFIQRLHFFTVPNFKALRFVNGRFLSAVASDFQPSSNKNEENSESKSHKESGSWSGKNAWKLGALSIATSAAFAAGCGIAVWGPPGRDENDVESIRDPISEKLLPDPVEPPYYQPPYTIVLEINDVLVHPDWKFRSGWRFKKRPALELFLQQLSPFYEVVAFTQDSAMTGIPVLAQIDSKGQYIHYRLFRESTRYRKGKHIKDLSCLNRDLSRVILVDWNPDAASMQPRNAFIINRWTGDESDRELIDLVAFLRMIAMSGVKDVRPVLDHYRQFDDPLAAFKEKHEQLMEAQARKKEQERMAAKKKSFGFNSFSGFRR
ncbi:mitochondrial import inner membrane translocase [Echinococcus multilocularis]|uniref:Mitochondrial import inner membrane translocase subunit TIM50 n=1 Tax=Echinococcus multilocularis TaxID=6211 RepID=A0A068XZ13_ECHMU|nr:mitochondrial import inner membrane translocase [Echinococcus multilocularis]